VPGGANGAEVVVAGLVEEFDFIVSHYRLSFLINYSYQFRVYFWFISGFSGLFPKD
jgi:hypothetical protein